MNYVQNEIARANEDKAETAEDSLRELGEMQLLLVGGGIADPILA